MQLLVRSVSSLILDASRVTEPVALAVMAALLLAIAAAQYRGAAAWGDMERERSERRWSDAVERAAGELNASVSDLYGAVVAAAQRRELSDDTELANLFSRWRARSTFGSFVEAVNGEALDATREMPFVASWVATDGLPSLRVSLPAGAVAAARFTLTSRACDRMREIIATGRVGVALPDVELAIAPGAGTPGRGCSTAGYDAGRPPEASAAVLRLGLPR